MKHQRGTSTVTVRALKRRGKIVYRVRYWENGKLHRPQFGSKKTADAQAAKLRGQMTHAEKVWASLLPEDKDRLIHYYEQGGKAESPTVRSVIDELIKAKRIAGRSDDYLDTVEIVLNQFANGAGSRKVNEFQLKDIEAFLDSKSLASRATLRSRLSTLFKFAVRRGYRNNNPCDQLEAVTITRQPPKVFTVEQFKEAVSWMTSHAKHGLAWFALSTLCGLRPEEAEQITKHDIHFDEGWIKVEAHATKVRQRRVVYPKPEAMKFLKWAMQHGGKLPMDSRTRKRMIGGCRGSNRKGPKRSQGLRAALGFTAWPKDITRHTAASYWLAGEGETVKHVAKMLGHSEAVCESRYKAVITQKQAAEFWKAVAEMAKPSP